MSELKRYAVSNSFRQDGEYFDEVYIADHVDAEIAKRRAELSRAQAAVRDDSWICCENIDATDIWLEKHAQAIEEAAHSQSASHD